MPAGPKDPAAHGGGGGGGGGVDGRAGGQAVGAGGAGSGSGAGQAAMGSSESRTNNTNPLDDNKCNTTSSTVAKRKRKNSNSSNPNNNNNSNSNSNSTADRPKGRPRGFRRDRDCRTCKARNVKCDLNRPSCGICVAQGIPCQGYATTVRWAAPVPVPAAERKLSLAPSPSLSSPSPASLSSPSIPSRGGGPVSSNNSKPPTSHASNTDPHTPPTNNNKNITLPHTLSSTSSSPSLQHHQQQQQQHHIPQPLSNKLHPQNPISTPLQVLPQHRAQWLSAALEENPDDANWTTHYLKYYEFFTSQFKIARRTVSKERRYKTDASLMQPAPRVDRDLADVWQLLWQRISGGQFNHHGGGGGSNNSSNNNNHNNNNSVELLSTHAAALAELNEAIRAGDILAIYGIVTLSFLDVFEGPFIDCQWHMHGAKALIQLHCDDAQSLDTLCNELAGLRQAISLLSWYDTMGFYFEQNRRNALVFPDWVRDAMDDDFFKLVFCPRDTFAVYAAVVKARTAYRGQPPPFRSLSSGGGVEAGGQQRDMKLAMLAVQQILCTSSHTAQPQPQPQHQHQQGQGQQQADNTTIPSAPPTTTNTTAATMTITTYSDPRIVQDCYRYAAALIATETAHASGELDIDGETAETLSQLADRVCDAIQAGVPSNSGRYRHLACQVTILGHHARSARHTQAVDDYWRRCDDLVRPIYPNGRIHSSSEAHWSRILGSSPATTAGGSSS